MNDTQMPVQHRRFWSIILLLLQSPAIREANVKISLAFPFNCFSIKSCLYQNDLYTAIVSMLMSLHKNKYK